MSKSIPHPPDDTDEANVEGGQWPLSYRMQTSQLPGSHRWWSHDLYRGPNNARVEVLYSKNKAASEILARKFLDEPVLGFDMEWPWNSEKYSRLQQKIGLIQVASEDKIGLFHIGLHAGKTTEDIIAPSLRELIESPVIAKTGVNVVGADFARLKKYFGLNPQAGFELSHLHRLVKFADKPELLTTRLVKLAYQVEEHLGLPLSKGKVRTSNWSRPLNQAQINYAAGDAYAGFMLFHCMNAKRAKIEPMPPLPLLADSYPSRTSGMGPITILRLHPIEAGGEVIMANEFFKVDEENNDVVANDAEEPRPNATSVDVKKRSKKAAPAKGESLKEPIDATSQALFEGLSARRKILANQAGLPAYRIASNAVLEGLARQRPLDDSQLLQVKGIGVQNQEKYGAEWLEVIKEFVTRTDAGPLSDVPMKTAGLSEGFNTSSEVLAPMPDRHTSPPPVTPARRPRRWKAEQPDDSDESSAFGSPVERTPQLHTGLSFNLAETTIDDPDDSDSSTAFATSQTEADVPLKRKRSEPSFPTLNLDPAEAPVQPLTPRSKLYRNKLLAFSKLVTKRLQSRPPDAAPIVSETTLNQIAIACPRTMDELHQVPGIEGFIQACVEAEMDLLRNVMKFAPAQG